jgi:DNA-binding NarL/FixJ family response regulator
MDTTQQIRVLVVDDHPVVREGIKAILSLESDFLVVGEAATGAEAMQMYRSTRPTVIVFDLLLPDVKGSEVIQKICAESSNTQVIVLTTITGDEEIYRALEAGARGYLFKDSARKDLVGAIRTVVAGRRYIPPPVGALLAENLPRSGLSAREIQVLELVATGMRNKEVAYQLEVTEATVNSHVKHILEKLNASDRTEAVVTALRRGFLRI